MKKIIILPFVLLAGCQMLSYNPPLSGDTATVTFTSDNIAAQPVVCVPGSGFQGTEVTLAHKPFDSDAFNDALKTMKKAKAVTVPVRASSTARIGVVYNQREAQNQTRDQCRVAVQFNAVPGQSYQAHFTRSHGQCGLSLTDANGVSADAVPVDWSCTP